MPESPVEKREWYEGEFGISTYDAFASTNNVAVTACFERYGGSIRVPEAGSE